MSNGQFDFLALTFSSVGSVRAHTHALVLLLDAYAIYTQVPIYIYINVCGLLAAASLSATRWRFELMDCHCACSSRCWGSFHSAAAATMPCYVKSWQQQYALSSSLSGRQQQAYNHIEDIWGSRGSSVQHMSNELPGCSAEANAFPICCSVATSRANVAAFAAVMLPAVVNNWTAVIAVLHWPLQY